MSIDIDLMWPMPEPETWEELSPIEQQELLQEEWTDQDIWAGPECVPYGWANLNP